MSLCQSQFPVPHVTIMYILRYTSVDQKKKKKIGRGRSEVFYHLNALFPKVNTLGPTARNTHSVPPAASPRKSRISLAAGIKG